ncbi:MAG TPA: thioesterase family protein [Candidatus Desulfobacillus sp.]|nr:thioesterase family protein [Candidatus Desulfobacillus sp.]
MSGETHPFDLATALAAEGEGAFAGHTHPGYANQVGPFGGVIAAALLRAVLAHPARAGDPLALTVNYAAPVKDGAFRIEAAPARSNRSTQHWRMALAQEGETAITATAVLAQRRETWSATESGPPPAPPWDALQRAEPVAVAEWTRRYDFRFVRGGMPPLPKQEKGEGADSVSILWMRDEPPRPLDFLSLAAFCDVFYPRIFIRRPRFVPIGTVSLTVYFHAGAGELAALGDAPLLGSARASHFGKGYHDQVAEVWSRDGSLLATSHQIVYFKE